MLEIKKLESSFLRSLSGRFLPGAISAILGPNGAGKSTLLKSICGITPLASGELLWNGAALALLDRKKRSKLIAYVPQSPSPSFSFSVAELVEMGRYAHGQSVKDAHLTKGALRTVDLWDLRARSICELSGGELQRAYIARAIVTQAPVIVLDEPTANLDVGHQLSLWSLLKRQASHGKTIIVATHDIALAERNAHELLLLDQGELLGWGSPEELLTPTSVEALYGVHPDSIPGKPGRQSPERTPALG